MGAINHEERLLEDFRVHLEKKLQHEGFGGIVRISVDHMSMMGPTYIVQGYDEVQNVQVQSRHEIRHPMSLGSHHSHHDHLSRLFEETFRIMMLELKKHGYKFYYDGPRHGFGIPSRHSHGEAPWGRISSEVVREPDVKNDIAENNLKKIKKNKKRIQTLLYYQS